MDTHSTLNNKIIKAHIRIMVYVLMLMILWVKTKKMNYGQIQEIWELDFHGFKISLFHCTWVDGIKGVIQDKYEFISVDLNRLGYKSEPFMLAKHISQVFYVSDTTNKRLKVVILGKQRIVRVENAVDEEEFDQFDEIPPFITSMIKPRIPSVNEVPYLRNDHHKKSRISKNQDRNIK
jgi:hypothetical protein